MNTAFSATAKAGLAVVLGVGALAWALTVLMFFSAAGGRPHGESFWFALAHASFLEWLVVAYCAAPFFPAVRRRTVAALYPLFGIVIGLYVLRAVVMSVITHTVPFLNSPGTHLLSALGGLLPMLALTGTLLVLNIWQRERDDTIRTERASLASMGAEVAEIYHGFVNSRPHLEAATYAAVEPILKKIKERFQFCTPFHRQPSGAPQLNEQIQDHLAMLRQLLGGIATLSTDQESAVSNTARETAEEILQMMERREKLLVK